MKCIKLFFILFIALNANSQDNNFINQFTHRTINDITVIYSNPSAGAIILDTVPPNTWVISRPHHYVGWSHISYNTINGFSLRKNLISKMDIIGDSINKSNLEYELKLKSIKRAEDSTFYITKIEQSLDSAKLYLALFHKHKPTKGFWVIENYITKGEYINKLHQKFTNLDKQKVKYIYVTVQYLNPVGDVVRTQKIKNIGPIDENGIASYTHDIFDQIITDVKISSINVEYFNKTVKYYKGKSILYYPNKLQGYIKNAQSYSEEGNLYLSLYERYIEKL